MSDAGSTSSDQDAFLKRYEAQTQAATAQTDFWHSQAKIWRRVAIGFASLVVAIGIVAILILNATHHEGTVTRNKADQTLGIARTFLCQQNPAPKGCPPAPPPTVSPNTQAIINDIITEIEHIYPPPNGLR